MNTTHALTKKLLAAAIGAAAVAVVGIGVAAAPVAAAERGGTPGVPNSLGQPGRQPPQTLPPVKNPPGGTPHPGGVKPFPFGLIDGIPILWLPHG